MAKREDFTSFETPSNSFPEPRQSSGLAADATDTSSPAAANGSLAPLSSTAAAPSSAFVATSALQSPPSPSRRAVASPRARTSRGASPSETPTIDVAASFAAAAASMRAGSSSRERLPHSSLLQHPRPPSLLPETGFSSFPATNFRSFSSSSCSQTAAAAASSSIATAQRRLTLPPTLPPAPWLWDSSLLEAFVPLSQSPAALAPEETRDDGDASAFTTGENPPAAPTAAMFLLPTSGGTILRLEEAYVCDTCCAVRAPEELSVEIEAYYCPNCFDSLTQTEALACGCCCTKCFDCPRCCTSLSVMRQPREASKAEVGKNSKIDLLASTSPAQSQPHDSMVIAAAVRSEAETAVRRVLHEAERRSSREDHDMERGEGRCFSVDEDISAAAAPQRCESLLSLSSDEDEDSSDQEEEKQHMQAGERNGRGRVGGGPLIEPSSGASREGSGDGINAQQEHEDKTHSCRRKECRYLYYFSCPYCRWNSRAVQITSESSALLPAAAIAEERVGGLLQRYFHQVLDVLQRAARDRERLRQLEARVKHKAVAILFAAAAAHDNRRFQAQTHLRPPRGENDETCSGVGAAATSAVNEQLLLDGGVPGASKSWRVTDVEQTLERRAAQNSFAHAGEAWTTVYRSDLQQPPQYVGLQQLLRGQHAVLQQQEEDKVMTDILFGWQLQQHEAAQLLKRSRSARERIDSRRRDSGLQEHLLEATGERRRSSIDATLETPLAVPLHSPQLLLDRSSPDSPPLKLPDERLRDRELYSTTGTSRRSDISSNTEQYIRSRTDDGETIHGWWTAEQATLEQRLRNPNSLIAATTSSSLLRPTRKKLLTRESKRCRMCTRYLVKAHVSSIAVPPFRVNTAAAMLLPWIVPRINRSAQPLRIGETADVRLNLLNPTDAPLRLKFCFQHVRSITLAGSAALQNKNHRGRESAGPAAGKKGQGGDTHGALHSLPTGKINHKCLLSPSVRAHGGPTAVSFGSGSEMINSKALVTAAETIDAPSEVKDSSRQHRTESAHSESLFTDWETVEMVTPDFELQLDRYDEMLGEFDDFDFASSRGSGSINADFSSRSASMTAVEWKRGNSAQVRLQARAKTGIECYDQQYPAICCVTVDVETVALQSDTLRVQYLLFLGHILRATGKAQNR